MKKYGILDESNGDCSLVFSIKYFVSSMKTKKKIFILHGWAYSTEKWKPFIGELKEDFDVEMLKMPGLTSPLNEVWDLDNYVEWLKNNLPASRQVLLGHSNGGRIALAFSAKYPEKVYKLILIDSAGIYHNEFPIRLKRFIFGTIAKVGKKFVKSSTMKIILYKFARVDDYAKANPIVKKTMVNLITNDCSQILKKIRIPTIIIWGSEDKITPVSDGQIMNEQIKDSRLYIINDARHSPMFTHVKEVVEIVSKNI